MIIGTYNGKKSIFFAEDLWKFFMGSLFILVPLALPGGLMSLPRLIRSLFDYLRKREMPDAIVTNGGTS